MELTGQSQIFPLLTYPAPLIHVPPQLNPTSNAASIPPHQTKPVNTTYGNNRPLRVANVNFQSIVGKKAEVLNLLDSVKPDVVTGTETWLTSVIDSAEIFPDIYTVYRKDLGNTNGGGVLSCTI